MTKQELIAAIQDNLDAPLPKTQVEMVLGALAKTAHKAMAKGRPLSLPRIGKITVRTRQARTAKNIRTGEPIAIGPKRQPKFTPSKFLKDACQEH